MEKSKRGRIALRVLYLGWAHDGLVPQPHTDDAVEQHLVRALLKTRLAESPDELELSRCGRTDRGVSAFCQVFGLRVRIANDDAPQLPYARMLNANLPETIRVLAWAQVHDDFSARFACTRRTYKYWIPSARLDVDAMRRAAGFLEGEHDFRNLCAIDHNKARLDTTYVRTIFTAELRHVQGQSTSSSSNVAEIVELTIAGSGFLWHQIRLIVHVLVLVGRGLEKAEIVEQLLDVARFPARPQFPMAAEQPLCLFDCRFALASGDGLEPEGLQWILDEKDHAKTTHLLQGQWTEAATRAAMISAMLAELEAESPSKVGNVEVPSANSPAPGIDAYVLGQSLTARYVPLASRKCCASLEDRRKKAQEKRLRKEVANDVGEKRTKFEQENGDCDGEGE